MSAIYIDLVDSSADSKSSSSNSGSSSSAPSSAADEVKKILDDVIENVTGVKKEKQQQRPVRSLYEEFQICECLVLVVQCLNVP